MHNVFISYHHDNDQFYKDELCRLNTQHGIFNDYSVSVGDISDSLSAEAIRAKIRDEYLRDSTVTIVLVGTETWGRKHVDWETYSSMFDGSVNKKSGILVIKLPSTGCTTYTAPHKYEKEIVHPENTNWMSIDTRAEYDARYPLMPERIIDNLLKKEALISVVPWEKIANDPAKLKFLIDAAHNDRSICQYDMSRPMRMRDA